MTNTMATPTQLNQNQIEAALRYFTGKALSNAQAALTRLNLATARGYWLPEDKSRSIRAALNKSSVAKKIARGFRSDFRHPFCHALTNMQYGNFEGIGNQDLLATYTKAGATENKDGKFQEAFTVLTAYKASFAAVRGALSALDATRPPPVFTSLGVSPTLTRTLKDLGLVVDSADLKVSLCPQRAEWIEQVRADTYMGKIRTVTVRIPVLVTEWPKHALLGVSRHANEGFNAFSQCHACGHGIKNPFNWVPLLVETAGRTYGLWVGRDCSKSLFGIEMKGDFVRSTADAKAVE